MQHPLDLAYNKGHYDIVKLLAERGRHSPRRIVDDERAIPQFQIDFDTSMTEY